MFVKLSLHPRKRLKTRTSTSVSSRLTVQWFVSWLCGPRLDLWVDGGYCSLYLPPLSSGLCCLLDSTHSVDILMTSWTKCSIGHELTVCHLFPKNLFSFSYFASQWSLRQWVIFRVLFNVTIMKMYFHFRWYLWHFMLSLCVLGSPSNYTAHSWLSTGDYARREWFSHGTVSYNFSVDNLVSFLCSVIKLPFSLATSAYAACSSHSWQVSISSFLLDSGSAETTPHSVFSCHSWACTYHSMPFTGKRPKLSLAPVTDMFFLCF